MTKNYVTQVFSVTISGTEIVQTSQGYISGLIVIKTQLFHFSNVVFPEFSNLYSESVYQQIVLL